jgi:uncharacterized alkaline shock family protein YloU
MNPEANTPTAPSAVTAGEIEIKPQVLFSLALEATLSTYGVVGLASRYTGFDVTHHEPRRGLDVKCVPAPDGTNHITVSAHVTVEYGVRISAVITSLQHQVTYCIEHSTGYVVDAVNVHVAGLRVTHED